LEVALLVARLGDQQSDFDQREDDAAEVVRAGDAPVAQHVGREQAELLPREIAAGPGELRSGHMTPEVQTRLEIFDRREHEEKAALVVWSATRANAREHIIGKLQFGHSVS